MHRKVFLYSSILLLFVVFSFTLEQVSADTSTTEETTTDESTTHHSTTDGSTTDGSTTDGSTTHHSTTDGSSTGGSTTGGTTGTAATGSTKVTKKSTKKTTKKYYGSYGSGYGSNNKNKGYGGGYDDNDDEVVSEDGIDPSKSGTDYGDFGPVRAKKPMLSQLDVWIASADDWQQKGSNGYNGKPSGGYNGKPSGGYNEKPSGGYKGSRNKRSYKQVRFPVKRIPNYRKFPVGRFPPLISILPWVPIFYDKLTYQTIIFSPTGGIYIIPPLINFYGQRFAVAQLIKWGYASLVSSGAPVGPGVDVGPLVQPPPPGGAVAAGVVGGGGPAPGPAPAYDSNKSRFNGGVKTDFRDFKPKYSQTLEEEGNSNYGPPSKGNYGVDSNYGGSRNQQVYPQGG